MNLDKGTSGPFFYDIVISLVKTIFFATKLVNTERSLDKYKEETLTSL